MLGDADIATVGAALADSARASMLLALVGGESLTPGELARRTGLSPRAPATTCAGSSAAA